MALVSPGVQVSVIDESFYTPAEPGMTPMIFVASAQDKTNSSGTGTAQGTSKANAGKPYLITSQRELADLFGDPTFLTDNNNNPIHAGELNEYGLQAAYSFLGVSNRAYVVRADIDTNQLVAEADAPAANPEDGTHWFDTQLSRIGLFEWNGNAITATGGQTFSNKVPTVITDASQLVGGGATSDPKPSVGSIGDYALVATTTLNRLYYKNGDNTWVKVGTSAWKRSWITVQGTATPTTMTSATDVMTINGEDITVGADIDALITAINLATSTTGVTAKKVNSKLTLYSDGTVYNSVDGITIANQTGTPLTDVGITAGTYYAPSLSIGPHTSVPAFKETDTESRPTGSLWFKTTDPNLGARLVVKKWNDSTQLWGDVSAPIYKDNSTALAQLDKSGGGQNLAVGTLYAQYNVSEDSDSEYDFKLFSRVSAGPTSVTSSTIEDATVATGSYQIDIQESDTGAAALKSAITVNVTIATSGSDGDAETTAEAIASAINGGAFEHVSASVTAQNKIVISHAEGGEIRFLDTNDLMADIGFSAYVDANNGTPNLYTAPAGDTANDFVATNWKVLTYTASAEAPTALAADGQLWYSSVVDEVDIMIHNGSTWVGYLDSTSPFYNALDAEKTDPAGPIVSATEPDEQSDGTALKTGDLWIDTSDIENYPTIYKYNADTAKWNLIDSGDQTTEDGILFADARYGTSGANSDEAADIDVLLTNNYLDPDAPDPALYPKGMLLWNLRRSGFNVKKFVRNYIDKTETNERMNESMSLYYSHRWVTESGNQANGAGTFGRKAQRKVVVQALQAMLNSNQEIRDDESRLFNVMATPGYPELIGEMIALNNDRGLTAFIVGDSPFRLTPDATSINEWATNVNLAVEDNDEGLVSRDEYLGVFYPSLFTSDNAGNNVVVPASHGILRTMALSDQVSYPWFAPAGTRRGGITNASAAGYIDAEGEFVSVALNEGQRDTLYSNNVNPVTFLQGAGLVNYGQKTRARNASSLDRINVARLVIYLRSQLNKLAKPYVFEPNDKITRDEIKQQVDSLLLELVGQRALYDFLVVCDESNNTPNRIDRNELYVDIAIEPVKAVEFIYIPLRLKNTGEIAGL